jgi:hypothetical protein
MVQNECGASAERVRSQCGTSAEPDDLKIINIRAKPIVSDSKEQGVFKKRFAGPIEYV